MADEADKAGASPLRRLATIVAIDAAGYSRQSETDEATAVREITALGERIRASAASRKGRVFNTAGDGFMLEFPSVSAAVAAAEEVQAVDRVPLRIGVHIGEVHETPAGDLLGRGVNIAARLMQAGEPGAIIISGDAKRALASDVAARLTRRGVIQLDKMSERIETFALGSPWRRPRAPPLRWVLGGAGALVLLAAGWFALQALRPQSQAIAVLEFRALEPNLESFTAGLADRLIGAVSAGDMQAVHTDAAAADDRVTAAARTGAAFVLDGTARADGQDLLVNARLIDTRGNIAVWTNEYRRGAGEQNYLQEEIAFDAARVLRCALISLEPHVRVDAATLAVFMRACQSRGRSAFTTEEGYQAAKQVTQAVPRFSHGWSMLGSIAAEMSLSGPLSEQTKVFATEAREAAERSSRLDRTNGERYLIEAMLSPPGDWRGRQALITRALDTEPSLAAAHAAQAEFYAAIGRSRAALQSLERAIAIEPLNARYQSLRTPMLNAVGRHDEAQQNNDRLYRIWPHSPDAWWNRFMNASYNGDPAEALRMLEDVTAGQGVARGRLREPELSRWRAFLLARQARDPARMRRAALAMRDLIPGFPRTSVAAALSLSGEVDAALTIAAGMLRVGYGPSSVFLPPWRNLRRDPRFMDLIGDTGLIQYWRETGGWPDFCGEPDLPYNCEAQAEQTLTL